MSAPRIPPLPREEWPEEIGAAIAALRGAKQRHPILTTEGGRPKGINALGTLANHIDLMTAYHTFTGHLLYNITLSLRQRELLILRVAHVRDCEYEWLQHVVVASDLGVTDEEIARVRRGADADGWEPLEAAMLRAVDELIEHAEVSDATWSSLAAELDTQQLMDLVFAVGAYDLLAMAFRTFGVRVDPDLAEWKRPSPKS